jgi:hypothetical protein
MIHSNTSVHCFAGAAGATGAAGAAGAGVFLDIMEKANAAKPTTARPTKIMVVELIQSAEHPVTLSNSPAALHLNVGATASSSLLYPSLQVIPGTGSLGAGFKILAAAVSSYPADAFMKESVPSVTFSDQVFWQRFSHVPLPIILVVPAV